MVLTFPTKLKSVYSFGLFVYARFNYHKYSSNVLKFKLISILCGMNRTENGTYRSAVYGGGSKAYFNIFILH